MPSGCAAGADKDNRSSDRDGSKIQNGDTDATVNANDSGGHSTWNSGTQPLDYCYMPSRELQLQLEMTTIRPLEISP